MNKGAIEQIGTFFKPKELHEKYRNDLARKLKSLKVKGEVGKHLSTTLLDEEKESSGYISTKILRKYGYGKDGATKLIEAGQFQFLAKNLKKFEGLDHNEIATKFIGSNLFDSNAEFLLKYIKNFNVNHHEIAIKIINTSCAHFIVDYIENLNVNHNEIVHKLAKKGTLQYVARNLEKFKGLDSSIALEIINLGGGAFGSRDYQKDFEHNLGSFQPLNKEVFLRMFHTPLGSEFVFENLNKFKGLDHDVAKILIKYGYSKEVEKNFNKFQG